MTPQFMLFSQACLLKSIFVEHISIGALGDSFYEYLLKSWLRSGKNETVLKDMYDEAMAAIKKNLFRHSKQNHLAYFAGKHY